MIPDFHILGTTERCKRDPALVTDAVRQEVRDTGWDARYWDDPVFPGHRGYLYDGRWKGPCRELIQRFALTETSRVLEVGCAKGYLLYELTQLLPGIEVCGLDISRYALEHAKEEVRDKLIEGTACDLPFEDKSFDLVISLATVYMLDERGCAKAIQETQRVGRDAVIQVVSYRNEAEREHMLSYDVGTVHKSVDEWSDWYADLGYTGEASWFVFV